MHPLYTGGILKWSVDGRPYRRNKAAFSNFSGVMWTLPKSAEYPAKVIKKMVIFFSGRLL